jgi:hypothetical protein
VPGFFLRPGISSASRTENLPIDPNCRVSAELKK